MAKIVENGLGARGDFVVVSDGVTSGDIRTRQAGVNTGGGSVIARHVRAGGSAGGFHVDDSAGLETLSLLPDASPTPANHILQVRNVANSALVEVQRWTNDGTSTIASLLTDIDAGVTFGDGSPNSGVALVANSEARSTVNMDFTVLGWQLITDVGSLIRLQIFKQSYASYDNSTWVDLSGISAGTNGMPRIAIGGGLKNTSSNLSGWTVTAPTLARGDAVRAVLTANGGGSGWYSLQLFGRRNVKKT